MVHPLVDNPDELFCSRSPPELLSAIRECLDDGHDFPFDQLPIKSPTSPLFSKLPFLRKSFPDDTSVPLAERMVTLAFGEVLLLFLNSLRTPVVPHHLFPLISQVISSDDTFEFLDALPHETANVWVSLTAYLQFICLQPSVGPVPRSEIIATVFSPILLRDPGPFGISPTLTPLQKRRFLSHFLV